MTPRVPGARAVASALAALLTATTLVMTHASRAGADGLVVTDDTPPTGIVVINGGRGRTTSRSVTLNLTASDTGAPASGVAAVRFSNDGVTFSAYEPYARALPWMLSAGDGTKRVWAQFRDGSGNESAVASDTIRLDTVGPRAVDLSPGRGARHVATTTKIKVVASEKLKRMTVTSKAVTLRSASGKVAVTVTYSGDRTSLTIAPTRALRHRVTYTVAVTGVKDSAGNLWDEKPRLAGAQPLRYSFTTR